MSWNQKPLVPALLADGIYSIYLHTMACPLAISPSAVNKFLSSVKVVNKIMSLDSAVTFLMEAKVGLCKGHLAVSIT